MPMASPFLHMKLALLTRLLNSFDPITKLKLERFLIQKLRELLVFIVEQKRVELKDEFDWPKTPVMHPLHADKLEILFSKNQLQNKKKFIISQVVFYLKK